MAPVKFTAVIITLNEEKNIGRCIDSVLPVVDEVVVVDSFSTDATEVICKAKGARFIQNTFLGHIQQQNFAKEQASFDYIVSLDADEELSSELQNSILRIKRDWQADAYRVSRLTSYCGQWIRHCGWYPDRNVRVWDRRKGKWGGENPHNKILIDEGNTVQNLQGDILHYSFPTIASHIRTLNSFSDIAAREAIKKGRRVNFLVDVVLNPFYTFIKKYFFQLGFLDGYYGFVVCINSAFANFAKYTKIIELKKNLISQKNSNKM